jgi:Leucine-rich repeat (LRR) protein
MEIALERIAKLGDRTVFSLSRMGLTELPPLPPTLIEFYCYKNAITSLPPLPPTLEVLDCDGNQLTELPPLPSTLVHLYCSDNAITELPPLPSTLVHLYCRNNPIQYPPADVLNKSTAYIREWMNENPLTFVKSANKV